MRTRGLRLPFPLRSDPVLTRDELQVLDRLLSEHLVWAAKAQESGRVSESILRVEIHAQSARSKIRRVLDA